MTGVDTHVAMRYTLMHADTPVFTGVFNEAGFDGLADVHDLNHVPVGCLDAFGRFDKLSFVDWMRRRQIPVTRQNFKDVLSGLPGLLPEVMARYNAMANLSDQYWIRPADSSLAYADVNFFQNGFGVDLLPILLSEENCLTEKPSLTTPSCTTGGDAPKAWRVEDDGSRVLYKTSATRFLQEPYNERIASRLLDIMGAEHVSYRMFDHSGIMCSVCPCAIGLGQDFVPAYDILQCMHRYSSGGFSDLDVYVDFAENAGVPNIRGHVEQQIVLDYLMRNTDRHWGNFGLVRDANTLAYLKAMPIFDNGNSLYHKNRRIEKNDDGVSRLTKMRLYQDLRYVKTFTPGMRAAAKQFSGIVEQVLISSDLPRSRKLVLSDIAEYRANKLLCYFGEPGLGRDRNRGVDIGFC